MIHNNTPINIYPQIIYADTNTTNDGAATTTTATLYLAIFDAATGQPANGNGISIIIQDVIDGVPSTPRSADVIGTQVKVYEGATQSVNNSTGTVTSSHVVNIVSWQGLTPDGPPTSNTICDVVVNSVTINQKESAPGAGDGQISIVAQSSQLPITYSLDGSTYQSSPTFNGLIGGFYTAYVSDGAGCTAIQSFTLDTVQNLLVSDPSTGVGAGNTSRWNAAFNPIVFSYQRKDFEVSSVMADGNGNMVVNVNANVSTLINGDMVYINAGAYKGVYAVASASFNQLFINSPATAPGTNAGFININRLRPYYRINTKITYFSWDNNRYESITSVNRPDQTGLVRADISNFLQSLLRAKDDGNYNAINYRDTNLSASYTISYAEEWDGLETEHPPVYLNITDPYYVVYAAKQLGEAYGGNLAAYVPFPTINSGSKLARWVTDFAEPAYSNHYPFDIGFIYSEALAGLSVYCELTLLDINRQPITGSTQTSFLLNENSSFLLNQDGSKLVIADASVSAQPIVAHVGLNRLLVNDVFPADACYFTLALKYDDDNHITHTITQTQTVRIDGMVDDQSVYLRWIGLSGSWNYYRFVYNQEVSLDVQNAVIIKNFVSDWANQQGIEEVISKSSGQKMKVMAEDLSVGDIKGLQSIKYSPKVQMLVGRNPIKWQTVVINTATFAEYETRNGQAPFSVTFNLPAINIQAQ